jgi:serine protease Do
MENVSGITTTLQSLSDDLGHTLERVSTSVVAIDARRYLSSSGVYWQDGVIVTAAHTIKQTEGISVLLPSGQRIPASLTGMDPTTDLAVLRAQSSELSVPNFADASRLKVGHLVMAAGRGAQRGFNAALGIMGVLGSAWRSLRGGLVDQFIALDLELHPAAAGGALVDARGSVLGITTPALSRNFPLALPASTVILKS